MVEVFPHAKFNEICPWQFIQKTKGSLDCSAITTDINTNITLFPRKSQHPFHDSSL